MLSFFHLRLERRAVEQSGFNSCPPGKIRQVLEIVKPFYGLKALLQGGYCS